jgi:excisionase family DNA binding protein
MTTRAPRVLLTAEEAAERLNIGRTTMFALIKSGAVESVKVGRLRRVPEAALAAYAGRLATEQDITLTEGN